MPPLAGSSEPIRFPSRFGGLKCLPTTMCPYQDHAYRLSQVPEFVKWKMQTMLDSIISLAYYLAEGQS